MKKRISSVIAFVKKTWCFIKQLVVLAKNIYKKKSPKTEYVDLAPINDATDCEEHIKALHWALSNPHVKNVALTGPYGSGKSSIIQTFLDCNPLIHDKSIQVSLATFSDKEDTGSLDLEEGILKQLFYKVKQNKIPQSRYRKIHRISYRNVLAITTLCVLLVGIMVFIFWPTGLEFIHNSVVEAGSKVKLSPIFSLSFFTVLIAGILAVIAKITQLCAFRFYIKDLKLPKEAGIVSSEPKENEILNKKIDEIVYFFEETRFRFVFFEDLDRFNEPEVFVKLREINTLLNNYDAIKENIVFIYAIKDEMFVGVERTKFFDFIIPVIPVINSTNSGEMLLSLLNVEEGQSTKHNISQEYIFDVSPFISDMRVLYNIYNEFLLYKQTIKTNQGLTTLKDSVMMSLIIFKNLQPDQFAKLQNEEGLVKAAFNLKATFVDTRRKEIQSEINEHVQVLESIENDTLNSQYELKYALLCAMTGWKGMVYSLRRNGYRTMYARKILESNFDFTELLQQGQWYISYRDITNDRDVHDVLSNVPEYCSAYAERLKYLQYSSDEEKQRRKELIAHLEAESQELSTLSLQDILNKFGAEKVFSTKEVSNIPKDSNTQKPFIAEQVYGNELLKFMLRKGYINEEYADYINFFKGNSISVADMNFIFSIKTQNPKEFTYSLSPSKLPQIVAKLQPHEFSERAILNFNLLEHMLSCHDYDDKLQIFIQQLSNESNNSWRFINEFIDKTNQHKRFIRMLAETWPGMWEDIYSNAALTYDRKIHYLNMLCQYLSNEELSKLNVNGSITHFFVENEDILQRLSSVTTEKLKDIITVLRIYFRRLSSTNISALLLDFIFDNCYYELNSDMIYRVVEYKNATLCSALNSKNYTTITELGYTPLLEYVHKNFGLYTDTIVMQEDNTKEAAHSVLEMLDRSIDDLERCNRIITHIDFNLDAVTEVCKKHISGNSVDVQKVWDMLLGNERLNVSWCAIYGYWKTFGLSAELCNYIVRHADVLANKDASWLDDDFKECIILSGMDIEPFKMILPQIRMEAFTVGIDKIEREKLKVMVHNRSFNFTVVDYEEMDQYAPELCEQFILLNQQEFDEVFDQITLKAKVFEPLVISKDLSNTIKERLIARDGVDLMTEKVASYLCSAEIDINRDVFATAWEMLEDTRRRKDLLFKYLEILELEDFEQYLVELDGPYKDLERRSYRHDVIIPDNQANRHLVSRLQLVRFLTSIAYETQIWYNPEREIPVIRCRVKAKQAGSALRSKH